MRHLARTDLTVRLATAYDAVATADPATDDEQVTFAVPESFDDLSDDELTSLIDDGLAAFDALAEADDVSAEQVAAMEQIADGIDRLRAEGAAREEARESRRTRAAELAARVAAEPTVDADPDDDADDADGDDEGEGDGDEQPTAEADEQPAAAEGDEQPEQLAASARSINVSVRTGRRARPAPTTDDTPRASLTAGAGMADRRPGDTVDLMAIGEAIAARARGINPQTFGRSGNHLSFGMAALHLPFSDDVTVDRDGRADEAMRAAVDPSRLPGGALTAAGWCAPSETMYDLLNVSGRGGILSLPEVNANRGGVRYTKGLDFATLAGDANAGFTYSEAEADAGDWDGAGGGTKPVYVVECPTFEDVRLGVDGVRVQAGLMELRAYPELIADVVEKVLILHDHRVAGDVLAQMIAGSTAVTFPTQAGATAGVLSTIEVQAIHYRNVHRMNDDAQLEAVLPVYARGVIRTDLARRLGVDLLDVPNSRIAGWFAERNISVQFVYNFDDLSGGAAARTAFPTQVRAVLYAAGTWVKATSDVITLENVYDSATFGTNDFTALFTEQAYAAVKRGFDSRVLTIPFDADGSTHGGIDIAHDGSEVAGI